MLPIASDAGPDVLTSAEWTLRSVTRLFASAPPGLVVASTDSLVLLPTALDWLELDARGTGAVIAVPMPLEEAIEHGVCTQAFVSLHSHAITLPHVTAGPRAGSGR